MTPTPGDALTRIRREIERTAFRARNGIKHLAGVTAAGVGPTPRIAVWSRDKVRLYRYQPDDGVPRGEPLLLVMSLVTRPTVFDLLPGNSLVASLLAAGRDVYMLDWGTPDAVESANTLETYCDEYLPRAVRAVADISGADDVDVLGYCLGGLLTLLCAAGHPELPVRALVLLAVPVDFAELGPLTALVRKPWFDITSVFDETGNVPASTIKQGMRQLDPTGDVKTYLNLWNSLEDDTLLAAHEAMVGWSGDHIPFPGAVFAQIAELFVRGDALVAGRIPLGGRIVDIHELALPVLSVEGEKDHIVPPSATAPLTDILRGARLEHLRVPAGHAGLFVGRRAHRQNVPAILAWIAGLSPREPTP